MSEITNKVFVIGEDCIIFISELQFYITRHEGTVYYTSYSRLSFNCIASSQDPPGSPTITGPEIVVLNTEITLTCSYSGIPATLQWFIDKQEITTGVFTRSFGSIDNVTVTASWTFIASLNEHLKVCECQADYGELVTLLSTTKLLEVHCKFHLNI